MLNNILDKVDGALGDAIAVIEREGASTAASGESDPLLRKFKGWRDEVDAMRHGGQQSSATSRLQQDAGPTAEEGGLYTD